MCNSGECLFEAGGANAGDCRIGDSKKFLEEYGESPCIVGGMPDSKEAEHYIAENREHLDAIYRQWEKKRIDRHE